MISRDAVRSIHAIAGGVGLVTVATFMTATLVVEAFGDPARVATVKAAIAFGLLLLVPALAVAGGGGFRLAGGAKAGVAGRKAARMRVVAANGLAILVPAALFLAARAASGGFDLVFYSVQAVELVAGAVNLALLSLNLRDGLAMARARRSRARAVG